MRILIGLLLTCTTSFGQIPVRVLKDSTLLRVADRVLDSLQMAPQAEGVLTFEVENLNVEQLGTEVADKRFGKVWKYEQIASFDLMVRYQRNGIHFDFHTPDFYFNYRGCFIFVFLGSEYLAKPDSRTKKQIRQMLKGRIEYDATSISPTFWFKVNGSNFRILSPHNP
jgi:hypothetical protein